MRNRGGVLDFVSPNQLLNFSFQPRINDALENPQEVEDIWRAMEIVSGSEAEAGSTAGVGSDMIISSASEAEEH